MVLVELNLSYRYGTSIYAVDRVNGTMYGKFSVGYKIIPEKATVIPQYTLQWRMSMGPPMKIPYLELLI